MRVGDHVPAFVLGFGSTYEGLKLDVPAPSARAAGVLAVPMRA